MIKFLQIIIDGGLVGLVYGLVAISFVVIYRASKIVNLAQGEVLVIGALYSGPSRSERRSLVCTSRFWPASR